jgi:hypothetical protein
MRIELAAQDISSVAYLSFQGSHIPFPVPITFLPTQFAEWQQYREGETVAKYINLRSNQQNAPAIP